MAVRFALLGAGRIGKTHAQAISGNSNAQLVSVYDPMDAAAKAISAQYGCEIRDLDEVAASDDVDAVAICTPTNTHADLIEKYAKAGKAIFCEKPIDLDLERVKTCLKTVEETGAKLMVGFNRRFDPHFKAVHDCITAGDIGDVEQVVISSRDPGLPPMDYISVSGGIFRDMMIHDFDMARFMLGEEIDTVFATGSVLVDDEVGKRGDVDTAMAILTTKSGKQAHINNSRRATYGYDQRVEVHGSKGMVQGQNPKLVMMEVANGEGYHSQPLHDFFMTRYTEAYAAEIATLIEAMASGSAMNPSGHDGLMALALAEAANLSMREGRAVKVSEVL